MEFKIIHPQNTDDLVIQHIQPDEKLLIHSLVERCINFGIWQLRIMNCASFPFFVRMYYRDLNQCYHMGVVSP